MLEGFSLLSEFFECPSCAVFILQGRRVLFANENARRMLAAGWPVTKSNADELCGITPSATEMLKTALVNPAPGSPWPNRSAESILCLAISADERKQSAVGYVRPLKLEAKGDFSLLVITHTTQETNHGLTAIGDAYNLSKAEVKVLAAFFEVSTLKDVAAHLGLKVTTIKSHMHSIMKKTGTRRQSELYSLFEISRSPFRTMRREVDSI